MRIAVLKILQLILREAEIGLKHSPVSGFQAAAKGPFGVLALTIIVIALACLWAR